MSRWASLTGHLDQLAKGCETLNRRINAVQHTLAMGRQRRQSRMEVMLEGFNDKYRNEVVARWGRDAYEAPTSSGTASR
jgi:hypothetical protein